MSDHVPARSSGSRCLSWHLLVVSVETRGEAPIVSGTSCRSTRHHRSGSSERNLGEESPRGIQGLDALASEVVALPARGFDRTER